MQAFEMDTIYTSLAQAIDKAGGQSELFLAMLSLKLATDIDDSKAVERSIQSVLLDLQTHTPSTPKGAA